MVFLRFLTLSAPDLIDTTEGRYASVAKLMLDRNDWVTPWINFKGVLKPYLGKPPLHFWAMDISYLAFGQNEFAARLPGVISAIGIGACLWRVASTLFSIEAAIACVSIFASSCGVFFLSGAVVLDMTLTLGVSLALTSFLLVGKIRGSGYLFFIGAGLGVLVKGPLSIVLVACTILPWAYITKIHEKRWPIQLTRLPWVSGALLFMAIVVPWYIWAEYRNPGFLQYFLWNENLGRYLKSDYGDEYGTGHRQVFGTALAYMVPALFPWSLIITGILIAGARWEIQGRNPLKSLAENPVVFYTLCWTLSCPVLLLAARQYTATYIVPSLPGFALFVAALWEQNRSRRWCSTESITLMLRTTIVGLGLVLVIGGTASLWFKSAPLTAAVSVLAGFALLSLSLHPDRFKNELTSIVYVSVFCCGTYACTILSFDQFISDKRSTRRALETVQTLFRDRTDIKVGFPFYFPFSATFYGPLGRPAAIDAIRIDETQISQPPADILLVRTRDLSKLRELSQSKEELAVVGEWHILKSQ